MKAKKFLLIGGSGYVGKEFSKQLNSKGIITHSLSRASGFDIFENTTELISLKDYQFDGIIFLAPVSGLIDQPSEENRNLYNKKIENIFYRLSQITDKKIIFLSSNHVFSGKNGPYAAFAIPDGDTWFSQAKLNSENQCYKFFENTLVVRTSLLLDENFSSAFFQWVKSSLKNNKCINIRSDIIASPTLVSSMVTDCISLIDRKSNPEPIHLSNGIQTNKFQIAYAFADKMGLDVKLIKEEKYDDSYPVAPGNYCLISNYSGETELSVNLVANILGQKF